MRDGQKLDERQQDLTLGSGMGMITKNREPNDRGWHTAVWF